MNDASWKIFHPQLAEFLHTLPVSNTPRVTFTPNLAAINEGFYHSGTG